MVVGLVAGVRKLLINSTASLLDRGFTLLRLSEFTQISDFCLVLMADFWQTFESFAKSVNLNKGSLSIPK